MAHIQSPSEDNLGPEDLTKEQIMQLAQWANTLNEENKNLKGYILQLQAQLQKARGDRAVAQHHLNNTQFRPTTIVINSQLEDEFNKKN